jgi:hypothetical protein
MTCTDCNQRRTDPDKPPFLQSLCVPCWERYRSTFAPLPAALTPPPR